MQQEHSKVFPSAGQTAQEAPADQYDRDLARKRAAEAAERATFHRVEAERWERIGRAAVAAAEILEAANPVEQSTPEAWASPQQSDAPDRF